MVGYVVAFLLKRYNKPSKQAQMQQRRDMFVCVLQEIGADDQPNGVESLSDYTRLWSKLIDHQG